MVGRLDGDISLSPGYGESIDFERVYACHNASVASSSEHALKYDFVSYLPLDSFCR